MSKIIHKISYTVKLLKHFIQLCYVNLPFRQNADIFIIKFNT